MLAMTAPPTALPRSAGHPLRVARRLVLVPADPRAGRDDAAVRRYRLARLRLEDRDVRPADRFAHCKRSYD